MVAPTGVVTELWRYPVKSLQGERVDAVEVIDAIGGDRAWGIIDATSGNLLSAKRFPQLLQAAATLGDTCEISLPGGELVQAGQPDVDDRLSAWLGVAVRLATPRPDETATIEIEWDEGLDELGEIAVFTFPTQPGWFFDSSSSLHLISTATLAHLETEVGSGAGDVRRFRPNIVIAFDDAGPAAPFAEDSWVEATLSLGAVSAWVNKRTERCVVTTRALPGIEASRDTLVWLARHHDRDAGISLQPRSPGTITVGDTVCVADPDPSIEKVGKGV